MTPTEARDKLEELFKQAYPQRPIVTAATLEQFQEAFDEFIAPHPNWLPALLALARELAKRPEELAQLRYIRQLCTQILALREARHENAQARYRYENALAELHAFCTPANVLALLGDPVEES